TKQPTGREDPTAAEPQSCVYGLKVNTQKRPEPTHKTGKDDGAGCQGLAIPTREVGPWVMRSPQKHA
ncbi:hypothetical protein P7K49_006045, partial [Saguinus oedipus]